METDGQRNVAAQRREEIILALILRRRLQNAGALNASGDFWNDSEGSVDWADYLAHCTQLGCEPRGPHDADSPADHDSSRCSDLVGQSAGQQTPEWRHSEKSHGIEAHHASAFVILH